MTPNGYRWQWTHLMPADTEMRVESGRTWFVLRASTRIAAYVSWDDAVERGWLEPVPWPDPETVGAFA